MSEINLEQLYEMQKELDTRIIRDKGLEGQDLLPNTVLALQVEIAELANEWRGFKHWSINREPRRHYERQCHACNGSGFFEDDANESDVCLYCEGTGIEEQYDPLLREYVDCLHFFLSIARQLELSDEDLYLPYPDEELIFETAIVFTELFHCIGMINGEIFLANAPKIDRKERFRDAWHIFWMLGEERLGYTFDQIATAYVEKNQKNHERQANGY